MDPSFRPAFNTAFSSRLYERYVARLQQEVGPVPFRLAETPLFINPILRDTLATHAREIVEQLSQPSRLQVLKQAIPARCFVPGMDELPNCMQVDFALCEGPDGQLVGRVVELQAFPSLYALMDFKVAAWAEELHTVAGLRHEWTGYLGGNRQAAVEQIRRMLLGNEDPEHVCLVDIFPERQKTRPDFVATRKLYGVDPVCLTQLIKRGPRLYRQKDGREVPVKRIYNRLVFDELDTKGIQPPFAWNEELDVSWCSHPNWYWTWSKHSLPHLDHPAVPQTSYLSSLTEVPEDLDAYVLKPLFSFAGAGVKVDVKRQDIEAIAPHQRPHWILQRKVDYAPAVRMPDGTGVKAEVRVMLARAPQESSMTPRQFLVRLSRGKMIGVDHNHNMEWTGGTVGIFPSG